MYKLTRFAQTRTPLPGVPWRDLSDEEFAAAELRYPELRERGYFEPGEVDAPPSRRRRTTEPAAEPEAPAEEAPE